MINTKPQYKQYHEDKKLNWKSIGLSFLIGSVILPITKFYWRNYIFPLRTSPRVISERGENQQYQKSLRDVYLINQSQNPWFDIETIVEYPYQIGVSIDPLNIEKMMTKIGNLEIDTNVLKYSEQKTQKDPNIDAEVLYIRKIDPGNSIKFRLYIDKKYYPKDFKIRIKIRNYRSEPSPILMSGDEILFHAREDRWMGFKEVKQER